MRFGIIRCISEHAVQCNASGSLYHHGRELGRIVAGSSTDGSSRPEIRREMTKNRQFGPKRGFEALRIRTLVQVMLTGVPQFESACIDRCVSGFGNQAAVSSEVEFAVEEAIEAPFFSIRFPAFSRVVQ